MTKRKTICPAGYCTHKEQRAEFAIPYSNTNYCLLYFTLPFYPLQGGATMPNSIGIIAEYNPFHNGHAYHIRAARKAVGTDNACVAVVMSGSFVQRGDVAICDKWARANMALECGADLIIELPVNFACSSAENFAQKAVAILKFLKITHTAFGAECTDLASLEIIAKILKEEPQWYKSALKSALNEGYSFPEARARAIGKEYANILLSPNNILAVEYLKADAPSPILTARKGANHDDRTIAPDGFASASAIRELIATENFDEIRELMPPIAHEILMERITGGSAPISIHSLSNAILFHLRAITPSDLCKTADISEGLENRIISAANESGTFDECIHKIKTRRYTLSRIRRAIINSFLSITAQQTVETPQYLRILGSTACGREYLKDNSFDVPVITKSAQYKDLLTLDTHATDIYMLAAPSPKHRVAGQDFTNSPVTIM